jgi:hypothetical protein
MKWSAIIGAAAKSRMCVMLRPYFLAHDLSKPLDAGWEVLPNKGWSFEQGPAGALFSAWEKGRHQVYVRSCSIPGDITRVVFDGASPRQGRFLVGFVAGFELIELWVDLGTGAMELKTHEYHKPQPRVKGKMPAGVSVLEVIRESCALAGMDYPGCRVIVVADGKEVLRSEPIDFLPEALLTFGFDGPGRVVIKRVEISGEKRPRPEYVKIGVWQQSIKPTTRENVDGLLVGVRQAAEAGVDILLTPETSLTGLRPDDGELADEKQVQGELERFCDGVRKIKDPPYTLVGYPEWVDGKEVEGALLEKVKINAHRFVRPDGTLGPLMAKVHSCETGLWHGRKYNLQRVRGVEIALGVCHDGRYQDVWAAGVMAGARVCFHAISAGKIPEGVNIPERLAGYQGLGQNLDAYWVFCNSGGDAGIVYPCANARVRNTVMATPAALSEKSPTWPVYSYMGDQLAAATIRLYDATGCYPVRTLRNGNAAYRAWRSLMPEVVEV